MKWLKYWLRMMPQLKYGTFIICKIHYAHSLTVKLFLSERCIHALFPFNSTSLLYSVVRERSDFVELMLDHGGLVNTAQGLTGK